MSSINLILGSAARCGAPKGEVNTGCHFDNAGRDVPLSPGTSYLLLEIEESPMPAPASTGATELPIDVVSDVVCPWCFIGKRRLEKANAQRIVMAARQDGLVYNLDAIARQPNTLDCHRLIRWSRESGDPARMKQRLMELYFTEGADLSDSEVLVGAARDCGMDADQVRQRLAGKEDVESVTAEAEQARSAGIDGVPCFILGGIFAVSGAQARSISPTRWNAPPPNAPNAKRQKWRRR